MALGKEALEAYARALDSWADWLERRPDPTSEREALTGIRAFASRLREEAEDAPLTQGEVEREVLTIAQEAAYASQGDHAKDWDWATEYVRETVDGHEWVIYTHRAQQLIAASRHDGAIEDASPESAFSDGAINWTAIAYFALEAEVFACLRETVCFHCDRSFAEVEGEDPIEDEDGDASCPQCRLTHDLSGDERITIRFTRWQPYDEDGDPVDCPEEETVETVEIDAPEIRTALASADTDEGFGEVIAKLVRGHRADPTACSSSPWTPGSWFYSDGEQSPKDGAYYGCNVHLHGFSEDHERAIAIAFGFVKAEG